MRYIIGLTGGIACGKSAVSDIFEKQGIPIIDTDIISKKVMQEGEDCYNEVVSNFPDSLIKGKLSRALLKEIVFNDKQKLAILNSITHKYIKEETIKEIEKQNGVAVVVVPLMFESGFDKLCDCIVSVSANKSERINRIINRDNISKELAENIINSQLSDEERKAKSDYVVENNSSIEDLTNQVNQVLKTILEKQK